MRQEAEGVTEALLESAKREFLKEGFHGASLRRISADSGVSTNSIYTRFQNKSGLFCAIVEKAAKGLMDIYLASIEMAGECEEYSAAFLEGDNGTDKVLEYIYRYQEEFQLIFCCSQGTEYEDYFDKLAQIEETFYSKFAKQYGAKENPIDDFFVHVLCRTGWQYIYELISHGKDYEEAKKYMENVRKFHYGGWMAVLEEK